MVTAGNAIANKQSGMPLIDIVKTRYSVCVPPCKRGPVEVSQISSHSLHAICKANQNPVDTRPPSAPR